MSTLITDAEFVQLKGFLRSKCGIDIPAEKKYLFATRLGACLKSHRLSSFSEFFARLDGDVRLERQLVEAMTTHETSFFRDGHPFTTLSREVFPALARRRAAQAQHALPRIRVWSAGCSTGEEPFSVAMSLCDWLATQSTYAPVNVSVLATDISRRALAKARRAVFTDAQVSRGLSDDHRRKYFRRTRSGWRARGEIRSMVCFAEVNLARALRHLGAFDLILCRNVLIYLSVALKGRILETFSEMLNPWGVLLLGGSEALHQLTDRFRSASSGSTIYHLRDSHE